MRNKKAKALRLAAQAMMPNQEVTKYLWVDPNKSDKGIYCQAMTGVEGTLIVDPTCERGSYLALKGGI